MRATIRWSRKRPAAGIQPGGHAVVVIGTIYSCWHILFARPYDLHRSLDLLPDAAPPASPSHTRVAGRSNRPGNGCDHHLLEREAGDAGSGGLRPAQRLRTGPHLAAIFPHVDGGSFIARAGMARKGPGTPRRFSSPRRRGPRRPGPCVRATTPGCCEAASSPCTTSAVLTVPLGPSSHRMASAAAPAWPPHVVGHHGDHIARLTTWRTPGMASPWLRPVPRPSPPPPGWPPQWRSSSPATARRCRTAPCVDLVRRVRRLAGVHQGEVLRILSATFSGTAVCPLFRASAPY